MCIRSHITSVTEVCTMAGSTLPLIPRLLCRDVCAVCSAFRLTETSAAIDPFSSHAFLPLVTALDRIVERFTVYHLVRWDAEPFRSSDV